MKIKIKPKSKPRKEQDWDTKYFMVREFIDSERKNGTSKSVLKNASEYIHLFLDRMTNKNHDYRVVMVNKKKRVDARSATGKWC